MELLFLFPELLGILIGFLLIVFFIFFKFSLKLVIKTLIEVLEGIGNLLKNSIKFVYGKLQQKRREKELTKEEKKKLKRKYKEQPEQVKKNPPVTKRREPKLNPKYAKLAKQLIEDSFTPPPNFKIKSSRESFKSYIKNEYIVPLNRELNKIVGQELAKKLLLSIIPKLAEERLLKNKHHKPVSFLLVGKTGVGKTETVKRVAEALKSVGYRFFRIDANQLRTPESVQSLFGSPRGYVGSDTVPLFIQEAVRSRGKMVILIDEIEKAHPDFIQAFMTLLDEGEITFTTTGERIKLQDSFIFITSNLKAEEIARAVAGEESEVNKLLVAKEMLKDCMLPEVLGRINYVVPFEDLKPHQYVEIIRRKLEELSLPADYETARKLYNYFVETGVVNRGVREVVKTVETFSIFPHELEKIVQV